MLICASCRTFGFSTIIAIFPDHKILAHVLGLEHVHALSRIDLAATATEQYICRKVILCAGKDLELQALLSGRIYCCHVCWMDYECGFYSLAASL
jgi:hypothetical protein